MKKIKYILLFLIYVLSQNTYSQVTQQWVSMYNGTANNYDEAKTMVIDNSGNVYVTGFSTGVGTNYDYLTLKYNSTGNQLWQARYNGPGNGIDEATSIAVDNSGNVYVTGYSIGIGLKEDYATIKYNSSGNELWVRRYNGLIDSGSRANAIAVDNSGNVFVTGYSSGPSLISGNDIATIKYNSNGDSVWVKRFNQSGNKGDVGNSIAVGDSGNVYITGYSNGFSSYSDYVTIKYNSAGILKWVQSYNGTNFTYDKAVSIALDKLDNIYVTGQSDGNGTDEDYVTLKYNPAGVRQWVKRYDNYQYRDIPNSLTLDDIGNVYVTGLSYGRETQFDYATIKYNTAGIQQWVTRYDNPIHRYDYGNSIAVDSSHNVYITGNCTNSANHSECTTIKYDSTGAVKWVESFIDAGGHAIKVDNSGNVLVSGSTDVNGTEDFITIKYSQLITGINSVLKDIPDYFSLSQNYPNPFNPSTVINYSIQSDVKGQTSNVKLIIYNSIGKEILYLVNEKQKAGSYSVEFSGEGLPSGIYFYKLEAGDFVETKRMVLMK